jgi:hypothetical protein
MMRKHGLLVKLFALAIGLALVMPSSDAEARRPKKKQSAAEPAALESPLTIRPKGLKFRMKRKGVLGVYGRIIEGDFSKKLKRASPGIQMQRLQHEITVKKQEFRLSYQEFDGKPTGLDTTPMRNEYSHLNREGYMEIQRRRKHRYLFFIKGKFWKQIDVYKLGSKSKFGTNFDEAIKGLEKKLGVKGRRQAADPDNGRESEEVDFSDGMTHLRLLNWGKKLAIVYVDKKTESNLGNLRKKKAGKGGNVDDSVKAIERDTSKDPRVNPKAQTRK